MKSRSPLIALALLLLTAGTALAWQKPTVTPLCATDATSYHFTVTLAGDEPSYDFDWSYDNFYDYTTVAGHKGDNDLFTLRDGTELRVRWSSDHRSVGKADANGDLCIPVETTPPTQPPATTAPPTTAPTPTPEITLPPTATEGSGPSTGGVDLFLGILGGALTLGALLIVGLAVFLMAAAGLPRRRER